MGLARVQIACALISHRPQLRELSVNEVIPALLSTMQCLVLSL